MMNGLVVLCSGCGWMMGWDGMGGLGLGSYIDLLRHVSATQSSTWITRFIQRVHKETHHIYNYSKTAIFPP